MIDHAVRVIDDERVKLASRGGSKGREASPVSPVDGAAFEVIERSINELFPGVPVVPYLLVAGTDSRYFYDITPNVYRFVPTSTRAMPRPSPMAATRGSRSRTSRVACASTTG